jgi:cytochrome c oxidase subunit 2
MLELFLEQASSYAGRIDWLFTLITLVVGFWLIMAEGVLFYFLFRFRRKDGVKALYITGEVSSQKKWINLPHALVILCDIVLIFGAISVWVHVKQKLPPPDAKIRVIGQQWAWIFVHPGPDGKLDTEDDISTVDELHVELGKVYHFDLESRDVVHSFSVPVFRLKQDVVPGRTITGWFKPTKPGEYDIQCAEICGIGHGVMAARMTIASPEDHKKWMAQLTPTEDSPRVAANTTGKASPTN